MSRVALFVALSLAGTGYFSYSIADDSCKSVDLFGNAHVVAEEVFRLTGLADSNGCANEEIDPATIQGRCDALKVHPKVADVRCGAIFFYDGVVRFEINVVEVGEEAEYLNPAPSSTKLFEPLPPEILELYHEHVGAWFEAFRSEEVIGEFASEGVVQYKSDALQNYVPRLVDLAGRNKGKIIQNLVLSPNESDRIASSWLLGWVKFNSSDLSYTAGAIMDRSMVVRNNFTRTLYLFAHDFSSQDVELLVPLLQRQMEMPSHADRNKALHVAAELIKGHDIARRLFSEPQSVSVLKEIANRSALSNVGGKASEILTMIGSNYDE